MKRDNSGTFKLIILILVLIVIAFFGGMLLEANTSNKGATVIDGEKSSQFKLPGFMSKRKVTVDNITATLKEIEEFSSYQVTYKVEKSEEETDYFLKKIKVPFTTNKIAIKCTGVVKVGYDISQIQVDVNNSKQEIYITLPDAKVNDNYIIWDSVNFNETNNLFNPIEFGQYKNLFQEIEAEGLKEAESNGVYQKAEDNFKKVINSALAAFGYSVIYTNDGPII